MSETPTNAILSKVFAEIDNDGAWPCLEGDEHLQDNASVNRFVWVPKERRRLETSEAGNNPKEYGSNAELYHVYCFGDTRESCRRMDDMLGTALEKVLAGFRFKHEDALWQEHEDGHRNFLLVCPVWFEVPRFQVSYPTDGTGGTPAQAVTEFILDEVQPEKATISPLIDDTPGNIDGQD